MMMALATRIEHSSLLARDRSHHTKCLTTASARSPTEQTVFRGLFQLLRKAARVAATTGEVPEALLVIGNLLPLVAHSHDGVCRGCNLRVTRAWKPSRQDRLDFLSIQHRDLRHN